MLDLSTSTNLIEMCCESFLRDFCAKNGRAQMMFCHVHPYWGQSHFYFSTNQHVDPYDGLVGSPIEYLINHEDWEENIGHLNDKDYVTFRIADGGQVATCEQGVVNIMGTIHYCRVIKSLLQRIDPAIVPDRIDIRSENHEYYHQWFQRGAEQDGGGQQATRPESK